MQTQALHTEEREGFTIEFFALPEDTSPADSFDPQDDDDTLERIASGSLDWFCAKVTASREGIELAADYLGCCCYESASRFPQDSGYFDDMCATVITEARAVIARLCAA